MDEYTLNDLTFTPKNLTEVPVGAGRDMDWDMDAINEQSRTDRETGEHLLREFREQETCDGSA